MSPDELLVLGNDDLRVEVVPSIGARLHRIRVSGQDVLRTPADIDEHRRNPFVWGAFPLVPWCNRVPGGRIVFEGQVVHVPMNIDGHAIHGLGYDRPWTVDADGLGVSLIGGDDLPWQWSAGQRYRVDGDGVFELTLAVRNDDRRPIPAGVGLHPWFDARFGLEVRVPADHMYPQHDNVPVGNPVPVDSRRDLRTLVSPVWGLDDLLTSLTEHRVELVWPGRLQGEVTFSASVDHVVVAAFDDLAAVAVEPQTHATDGFRRGRDGEPGGIAVIGPGESVAVTYRFRFT